MQESKEKKIGYLLGQITALVESVLTDIEGGAIVKSRFPSTIYENPVKIMPFLIEVMKMELLPFPGEIIYKSEFMDAASELLNHWESGNKRMSVEERGDYWIGYYHQKSKQSILLTRQKIGKKIKELRESKNMSQRQLEKMTGLTHNHICRIEAGKYNLSIDTLSRLCTALDAEITIFNE